jgi:hypothetical protein
MSEYTLTYEQAKAAAERGCIVASDSGDVIGVPHRIKDGSWEALKFDGLFEPIGILDSERSASWRIIHDPADYAPQPPPTSELNAQYRKGYIDGVSDTERRNGVTRELPVHDLFELLADPCTCSGIKPLCPRCIAITLRPANEPAVNPAELDFLYEPLRHLPRTEGLWINSGWPDSYIEKMRAKFNCRPQSGRLLADKDPQPDFFDPEAPGHA